MTDTSEPGEAAETFEAAPPPRTRYGVLVVESIGTDVLFPTLEQYLELMTSLRADGFNMIVDLTAVDYLTFRANRAVPADIVAQRFELVVSARSTDTREIIRVRLQIDDTDLVAPSLFDVWPGSEALEREVFDLFGISFDDHPDLSRILMPEDWVGHPLRKDFAIGSIPVQFRSPSNVR